MKRTLLFAALLCCAGLAQAQTVLPGTKIGNMSFTAGTAAVTVAEQAVFTAVGDTSGSLNNLHLTICLPNGGVCYAPWFNVNSAGVAPTVTGHTNVEVAVATDATAGAVGDALQAAATAIDGLTCTDNNSGVVTCLADAKGPATDATAGDTGWGAPVITQGVASTALIGSADIMSGVMGWRVCNASGNASTWMAIGKAVDTDTDGVRLAPGSCIDCPSCARDTLGLMKVSAQAGSNAYSVVQFKQ